MGLASVVHSGVQIPSIFHHSLSHRVSVLHSPPPSKCSSFGLFFAPHTNSPFFSVYHSSRAHFLPVLCSKRVDKDSRSPESDVKRTSSKPNEEIRNAETSKVIRPPESGENTTYSSSVRSLALWVSAAVAFGVGLGFKNGVDKASEFFAGYILEQSLSVDNLFVFVLIFKYFKVPLMYQSRVLSYGIVGAVIFRLTLILLGTATLQRFEAVNLLLAAILLYSSFKLFASEEDESDLSDNYVMKTCQKFIPVTTYYDGNQFITNQDGIWKGSNILGRPPLCFGL